MRRLADAARPLLVPALLVIFAVATSLLAGHFVTADLALGALNREGTSWRAFAELKPSLALGAFITLYAAALVCFVPIALILTFISGFLFSPPLGAAASVAGACVGASLSYALGRFSLPALSKGDLFPAWAGLSRVLDGVRAHTFRVTVLVRLLPLTPFNLFSLAAGGLHAPFWPFLAGTALGVIPECGAYALLGRHLGALLSTTRPVAVSDVIQPGLLIPLVILAAVSACSLLIAPGADRLRRSPRILEEGGQR